jgi:N-acetylmuramoyl-L-alanine amidase
MSTTMKFLSLCALCVLCGAFPLGAAATPPVRTMYNDAMAKEQAVRTELESPEAAPSVLTQVHAVITAYEAIVRHYPASGYSDNALWQAGRLSFDAFGRFKQSTDRELGVRLLRRLAVEYPTSKLAKQVPDQLARVDAADDPAIARPKAAPQPVVAPVKAPPPEKITVTTIKEIRRSVLPDAVRITIELDGEVPFHEERIADPARVFVDLPSTRAVPSLIDQTLRFEGDADIVRQVRVGRHPNNTTRIVLDAAGVTSYSVYPLYSPYRLVIDCVRVPAAVAMTNTVLARAQPAPKEVTPLPRGLAPLASRTLMTNWMRKMPGTAPGATTLLALAHQRTDGPPAMTPATVEPAPRRIADTKTPEPAPLAPPPVTSGGLSMARQLGLGVSRIVIDAGHGGHDPGAKGKGFNEAELVLDVALRLEKLLQKVPGVEVILTRRTDDFIPLPARTAIANREGADLFLSIHANASTNAQAHGIETYFLNFANNQSAAAVAARENAASTQAMGGLPDFVRAIAQNNKLDESRDFALHVQRAMVDRQKAANKALKDLGVKQAPFVVLIGANMPSVLAEMGFVTNAQEAKLLKGNAYRQRIAESLFAAIRKYQSSLKNVSTVAHQ